MVGVANPLFSLDRRGARRFLAALMAGSILSSAILGSMLVVLSSVAAAAPNGIRVAATVAGTTAFGMADVLGRTPQLRRQVPQRFALQLPPGRRGAVWGLDLGSHISTRKTSSFLWVAILGAVLVGPSYSAAIVV